ncbi:hypothetical protein B0H10DRAFT_2245989 [Mycena sp. CBHHK59/15]|nr:hypothetical protein B0H10DRAFT_2245989 [Mycena sp. CBHHK59/15]
MAVHNLLPTQNSKIQKAISGDSHSITVSGGENPRVYSLDVDPKTVDKALKVTYFAEQQEYALDFPEFGGGDV